MFVKVMGYDEAKEMYGSFSELFVDDQDDLPENIPEGWGKLVFDTLMDVNELNKKTDDIMVSVEVLDADLDVAVLSGERPELDQIIYGSILASRTTCMRCSGSSWVRIRPVEGKFRRLCEGCWHMLLKPAGDEPAAEQNTPTKTGTWLDEY